VGGSTNTNADRDLRNRILVCATICRTDIRNQRAFWQGCACANLVCLVSAVVDMGSVLHGRATCRDRPGSRPGCAESSTGTSTPVVWRGGPPPARQLQDKSSTCAPDLRRPLRSARRGGTGTVILGEPVAVLIVMFRHFVRVRRSRWAGDRRIPGRVEAPASYLGVMADRADD